MRPICSHSNRGVLRKSPLLVLERNVRRAAGKTTNNAEAQTSHSASGVLHQIYGSPSLIAASR